MNFITYGNIDVSEIKPLLIDTDDWDIETRNQVFYTHRNTKSISLIQGFGVDEGKEKTHFYKKYYHTKFFERLFGIIKTIAGIGEPVRILFTKLHANTVIPMHRDTGVSLSTCNRIHIPIITNRDVLFIIDGDVRHGIEGDIYEIDNTKEHGVLNKSNQDRIHLIVDWKRTCI